jgi:predicted membrane protein
MEEEYEIECDYCEKLTVLNLDEEFRNQFFGDIHYLEIKRDDKTIFKSNFNRKTEFKIFDESNSGNHLLKYNGEWY